MSGVTNMLLMTRCLKSLLLCSPCFPHFDSSTLSSGCQTQTGWLLLPDTAGKKKLSGFLLHTHQRGENFISRECSWLFFSSCKVPVHRIFMIVPSLYHEILPLANDLSALINHQPAKPCDYGNIRYEENIRCSAKTKSFVGRSQLTKQVFSAFKGLSIQQKHKNKCMWMNWPCFSTAPFFSFFLLSNGLLLVKLKNMFRWEMTSDQINAFQGKKILCIQCHPWFSSIDQLNGRSLGFFVVNITQL